MKKIIALLLCLLMIVGMVACATNTDNNDQTDGSQDTTPATENSDSSDDTNGNDGDVVTITYSYWGTPDEAASVQAVADKFHEEYPNIKVEVMAIPNEEYVTKLNTMATAGELPDCGIMNESGVLDFASDGTTSPPCTRAPTPCPLIPSPSRAKASPLLTPLRTKSCPCTTTRTCLMPPAWTIRPLPRL